MPYVALRGSLRPGQAHIHHAVGKRQSTGFVKRLPPAWDLSDEEVFRKNYEAVLNINKQEERRLIATSERSSRLHVTSDEKYQRREILNELKSTTLLELLREHQQGAIELLTDSENGWGNLGRRFPGSLISVFQSENPERTLIVRQQELDRHRAVVKFKHRRCAIVFDTQVSPATIIIINQESNEFLLLEESSFRNKIFLKSFCNLNYCNQKESDLRSHQQSEQLNDFNKIISKEEDEVFKILLKDEQHQSAVIGISICLLSEDIRRRNIGDEFNSSIISYSLIETSENENISRYEIIKFEEVFSHPIIVVCDLNTGIQLYLNQFCLVAESLVLQSEASFVGISLFEMFLSFFKNTFLPCFNLPEVLTTRIIQFGLSQYRLYDEAVSFATLEKQHLCFPELPFCDVLLEQCRATARSKQAMAIQRYYRCYAAKKEIAKLRGSRTEAEKISVAVQFKNHMICELQRLCRGYSARVAVGYAKNEKLFQILKASLRAKRSEYRRRNLLVQSKIIEIQSSVRRGAARLVFKAKQYLVRSYISALIKVENEPETDYRLGSSCDIDSCSSGQDAGQLVPEYLYAETPNHRSTWCRIAGRMSRINSSDLIWKSSNNRYTIKSINNEDLKYWSVSEGIRVIGKSIDCAYLPHEVDCWNSKTAVGWAKNCFQIKALKC